MDKDKVAPALGTIASGLYIATAVGSDGKPIGMLSSFVEQASFAPPMITIAVVPDRRLALALEAGSKLGLNVLGQSRGGALMKPFISSSEEDPFAKVELQENGHGIPQLSDALAFLVCELRGKLNAGDHHVYLCEVLDGEMPSTTEKKDEPMIRVRANGFSY